MGRLGGLGGPQGGQGRAFLGPRVPHMEGRLEWRYH